MDRIFCDDLVPNFFVYLGKGKIADMSEQDIIIKVYEISYNIQYVYKVYIRKADFLVLTQSLP